MFLVLFLILVALFVALPRAGMALWALWTTVVVGLILGALGRLIVPGPQRIGLLATLIAGLCGSILGGFLGQHVLDAGRFVTVLMEIGVAALVVAAMAAVTNRGCRTACSPRAALVGRPETRRRKLAGRKARSQAVISAEFPASSSQAAH
jgi:uncharacterized membrane protein YeaQ/YmgE (transglycosylase-associated protein family)